MTAYYNEIDKFAAQWLRNLIAAGHIAAGDVDERSITEVHPDDLRGYDQCHFFAGIGGWSLALRLAGWPDDRPVWTGSCPCQPFSTAGKQRGSDDERHLWPAFFRLIRECRPASVYGEQVAGSSGYAWWDHVAADMEGEGYAAAAVDIGAHSVGAPHIRQRLYWVAQPDEGQRGQRRAAPGREDGAHAEPAGRGAIGFVADANQGERGRVANGERCQCSRPTTGRQQSDGIAEPCCHVVGLGDANHKGLEGRRNESGKHAGQFTVRAASVGVLEYTASAGREVPIQQCGNGESQNRVWTANKHRGASAHDPWADLNWLPCSDGKARPTQPGLFPLAHGVSGRVGRLRAYGNAIVAPLAAAFIKAAA